MGSHQDRLDTIHAIAEQMAARGLLLRTAEDEELDGRSVRIDGKPRIHFGSCSYLGLELDPRLRQGAIDAIVRYGTQFSSSRSYLSAPLYQELEFLLERLFGGPTVITPSTTLAHASALPVLIGERDAVLVDHQVHASVRMATDRVRLSGARLEVLPHNDMSRLEDRLEDLRRSHPHVWYLVDGVYSMFGDLAPMRELEQLLSRFEQLHLYVDDAHGMGWCGPHGRGYALSVIPRHPRLVVATSLNKCFGAGGGALILPTEAMRRRMRLVARPLMFSGPLQPPSLGAALASARIHLSPEIEVLQRRLRERIAAFNRRADELGLPLAEGSESPIRYLAMGWPTIAAEMASHLFEQGFWTQIASFPAVLARQSGVRCNLTLHQSLADIDRLLAAVALHLPAVLAREATSVADVRRQFGLAPAAEAPSAARPTAPRATPSLRCAVERSIDSLDSAEWDRLLGARGIFTAEGLRLLEAGFRGHARPEDNWGFHYFTVRDRAGKVVLATFFTDALWKGDLLAPASVSRRVEEIRRDDPYFLVSRVFSMGSLLTEGDHLYLDRDADWRSAMSLLLVHAAECAEACESEALVLRDLPAADDSLGGLLAERGFAKASLPDSMVLEIDWRSEHEFLGRLPRDFRRFQRREVQPWAGAYDVEVLTQGGRSPSEEEWAHLHRLYQEVRSRNLALNSFALPQGLFRAMLAHPGWELVLLRLRPEAGGARGEPPSAFLAGYAGPGFYTPLVVGLDYERVRSHGLYRRCILECLHRAQAHGAERIFFGIGAELEKRRFGARREKRAMYLRSDDHFGLDQLAELEVDALLASRRAAAPARALARVRPGRAARSA